MPELKALIGKNVEIIVLEEQAPAIIPGTGDWEAARKAGAELEDYDFDAWRKQREYDLKHAKDQTAEDALGESFGRRINRSDPTEVHGKVVVVLDHLEFRMLQAQPLAPHPRFSRPAAKARAASRYQ